MLDDTIEPIQIRRICGVRINYAKLEGNGDKDLRSARIKKKSPPSRQSKALQAPLLAEQKCCAPDENARKEGAKMTSDDWKVAEQSSKMDETLQFSLRNEPSKSVEIDVEKYQAYLDDPDLSDEERKQLVHLIWQIMMAFVDLGFGVHPVQQACGKTTENTDNAGNRDSSMLNSKPTTLSDEFNSIVAE